MTRSRIKRPNQPITEKVQKEKVKSNEKTTK